VDCIDSIIDAFIHRLNSSGYIHLSLQPLCIVFADQLFQLFYQWNVKKEMELRHGGAWYHISPWGLSWDDENYYMIGYDAEAQMIKHYRVDKMLHIRMSGESREGKEHFKKLDMADYAKKSFGMFRGKETSVKMLVNNSLAGVIIDRFGKRA
jgi:hypothetical protein